jgi:hypothetical protein
MTAKKTAAILIALVLTFTAAACGSSKKSDDASTAGADQSEKQSDGGGTTTTTKARSTTTTGDGSSSGLGLAGSSECLAAYTAYSSLFLEATGFATGADQSQIDDFEQKTNDLKAKIPSEVQADFQTVADAYQQYAEALKGLDFTDILNPDTQQKLQDASDKIDDQAVKDAQSRIEDYFKTTCGN